MVAHPLLMHCRATRAHGRPAPRTRVCAFFSLRRTATRSRSQPLASRLPLRCFPTSPLRLPSLFCGQEPTPAPASAASPPSPFQLSTRPQNLAPHPRAASQPPARLSRIGPAALLSFLLPILPPSLFCGQAVTTARSLAASPPSPLQLSTRPPKSRPKPPARNLPPAYRESAPLRSFPSSSPSSPPHYSEGKL